MRKKYFRYILINITTISKINNNNNIIKVFQKYQYSIFVFKSGLDLNNIIIYIQKPFLENQSISYSELHSYSSSKIDKNI